MATVTATDFLVATGTPGLWVRLHSNVSGTDYYSTAVSDPQGSFTYSVPAGDYSLYTGVAATVPGTPTLRSAHYQVAIRNGDDGAVNSLTSTIGPYGAFLPGTGRTIPTPAGLATGAVADYGGQVWNVKAFGAVGDGTSHPLSGYFATLAAAQVVYPHATSLTNEIDWAAIQAAINALPANSGGLVYFPIGIYLITTTIQVNFPARIPISIGLAGPSKSGQLGVGALAGGATLKFVNSANVDMIVIGNDTAPVDNANSGRDCFIDNLHLDGNKANNTSGNGITTKGLAGGGITECTIHDFAGHGINIIGSAAAGAGSGCCLNIFHNTIEFNNGMGINENNNIYDWIVENHIELNKQTGINAAAGKNHILYNNILQAGKNYGSESGNSCGIWNQGGLNRIIGNYIEVACFDGMIITATYCSIIGNLINDAGAQDGGHSSSCYVIQGQHNTISGNIAATGGSPTANFGFEERAGSDQNKFIGNISQQQLNGKFSVLAASTSVFRDNDGLNPRVVTTPAVSTPLTNGFGVDVYVVFNANAAGTTFTVNTKTLPATPASAQSGFLWPAGTAMSYVGAPSAWAFIGN